MDIRFTSSGHYSIPISKSYEALNKFSVKKYDSILLSIDNITLKTQNEARKIAENLCKQFGYSGTNKILKLVKTSRIEDSGLFELIDEIGEDCSISLKYKKAPLKPVVGLSLLKHFNDVISVDLNKKNAHKILYMLDHTTHFSSVAVLKTKHEEEIVKAIFQYWSVLFGPQNQRLSDNGGELNSEFLREISDQLKDNSIQLIN